MMQKFQENADDFEFPVLNESEKIIILADESTEANIELLELLLIQHFQNSLKITFLLESSY